MIAQWMFGAVVFTALCALASFAAERALRALRRPSRAPWALAMTIAALWPLVAPLILTPIAPIANVTVGVFSELSPAPTGPGSAMTDMIPSFWLERLDTMLVTVWVLASALLFAQVVLAVRTIRDVRRHAKPMRVDNEQVLVDALLGPAVIGLRNPTIVIPAWLLELDDALQSLVLRHEREHCRTHDARLVWLATTITTLLPWNLALWWMAHRLRDAMEIDCDARTLRSADDRTLYAKLLLLIAQQKSSARFAPMLSNSTSQLHTRILAMHATPPRYPLFRAALATAVALVAVATACSSRMASNIVSPAAVPSAEPTTVTTTDALADGPATLVPSSRGPAFPASLKAAGVSGSVLAEFVVNNDGSVDTTTLKVMRSTDPAFAQAVRAELSSLRYSPARVGGRAVRQLVTQAFQFVAENARAAVITPQMSNASLIARPQSPVQIAMDEHKAYFDFQVEVPAKLRAGQGPQYPKSLRDAGVQGQVLTQFVVDSKGRVDMRTFKVLKSDHELFSDAARAALADMQFDPATIGGRGVSQLLQTPFKFSISR